VRLTHNEAQGGWVLLAPERVFKADQIAVEIIKRCTGEATFGEIIDDLAKTFPFRTTAENPCGCQRAVARLGRQEAAGIVIRSQRPHLWRAATRHS
jgi:coenzyme PQQ biosynthesis protein PqqD